MLRQCNVFSAKEYDGVWQPLDSPFSSKFVLLRDREGLILSPPQENPCLRLSLCDGIEKGVGVLRLFDEDLHALELDQLRMIHKSVRRHGLVVMRGLAKPLGPSQLQAFLSQLHSQVLP